MSDALGDAIAALGAVLEPMTGLVRWFDDPPEAISEFPAGMAFAVSGEITAVTSGFNRGLHKIRIAIYLSRTVLPTAVDAAKVWPYRIHTALVADQTLSGKVQAIVWPLSYRCGPMFYGGETHFGVAADVTVKI